jgi:hypothetical protein
MVINAYMGQGRGIYTYPTYIIMVIKPFMGQGRGIYTFPNLDTYDGEWKRDLVDGTHSF